MKNTISKWKQPQCVSSTETANKKFYLSHELKKRVKKIYLQLFSTFTASNRNDIKKI